MGIGTIDARGCIVEQLLGEKLYSMVMSLDDILAIVDIKIYVLCATSRAGIGASLPWHPDLQ